MTSLRRSLAFEPIRVASTRSAMAPAGGVRGARVSIGPHGTYVGFDGRGFSYRIKLDDTPGGQAAVVGADDVMRELEERRRRSNLFKAYLWSVGVLLFLVLTASGEAFLCFLVLAVVGGFFVRRWDEERRAARIFYDVDNQEIVGRLALCNVAGEALSRTAMLWHVYNSTSTRALKYNAGAGTIVQRTPTRFAPGSIDGIDLNVDCWGMGVGPQQLLLLPDRLIVREGTRYFAMPYEWIAAVHAITRFVEEGHVPPDSAVVDTTWRFVNKSGGPDRRFNNNRQLPVLAYGELTLRSNNGMAIVIQSSNPAATQYAAAALNELARIAREPAVANNPFVPAPTPSIPTQPRPPTPRAPEVRPPRPTPPAVPTPAVHYQPVRHVGPAARPLPPPVPILRPRPRTAVHTPSAAARFIGPTETLSVWGRAISNPLTYVSDAKSFDTDASTIVLSLAVGTAAHALPMPYWPRYSEADPDQRARYLDWAAGGRKDPSIPLGYVFIFFYGLERRVLIDGADEDLAHNEVRRLLGIYGANRSFRTYASDFLAFTPLRNIERLLAMPDAQVATLLGQLAGDSATAVAAITAWHHVQQRPLPAQYAASVVRDMESAKRGTVVTRSGAELLDLFTIRYRETFGEGLRLDAAKRPLTIEYRPASPTLLEYGRSIKVTLPDVLGRSGQFRKVVELWNDCVDDLRKVNAKKAGAKVLDAAAWSALPAELREQYDHPDQDRWDGGVAAMPLLAGFHLASVSQLAELARLEKNEKYTAAQLKKIAARAAEVGYAMEPDPRVRAKATPSAGEVLLWRSDSTEAEPKVYGAVSTMLSLAMTVAMADGVFTDEEQNVINSFLTELFTLDNSMRTRIEAMKQLMMRDSSRLGSVAKTLRDTRTPAELAKVGAVLVAIAAADGTIAETEEKALRSLYKNLGLAASELAAAIARTGARLERDAVVEAQTGPKGAAGVPIPPPPDDEPKLRLDHAAIDAIVADTKDVAAILAEVFDSEPEERTSLPTPPVSSSPLPETKLPALPRASDETTALAQGLDVRYHAVLEELLDRPLWASTDVRQLAERHRLMPAAILDTINAWSDDAFGDFLIEDAGEWKVNRDLVKVNA